MVSKTKFEIDESGIAALFAAAGLSDAANFAPLGAGEYNAVFSATAGGKNYVLKIAPHDSLDVMTLERGMMRSEVMWYEKMRTQTKIRVPQVSYFDDSRALIPAAYFIMEKLDGEQLDKMQFTQEEKLHSDVATAEMAAQIHAVRGTEGFGYVQNGLHENWYLAIRAMTQAVVDDCIKKGRRTKRGEQLLSYIDTYKSVLETAECCMVNFDIWAPNILCTRENGAVQYAWIDPERSFWGDRIADFVCLEMMKPLREKTQSLKAYNAKAALPVLVTQEEETRYAIALGYLAAIMETERYYRYTPRHFGWWRNVLASRMLYQKAFAALKKNA